MKNIKKFRVFSEESKSLECQSECIIDHLLDYEDENKSAALKKLPKRGQVFDGQSNGCLKEN